MTHRIVLYSHDSVGLGHVTRNVAIAHALSRVVPAATGEAVCGLVVTGQSSATERALPEGWDWVVLPGVTRTADGYAPRHLRTKMKRLTSMRGALVDATLVRFEPDLLVVDRHALGIERELEPALTRLRAAGHRCRVVLGLREVLDDPATTDREWAALGGAAAVRRLVDDVWVYGDPDVHDPVATGEVPAALAGSVHHTGYLAHGRPRGRSSEQPRSPYVMTVLGGGSDGVDVAVAAAASRVPDGFEHLLVTGPQMSEPDRARVRDAAARGTIVRDRVADAHALVDDASAVITMGGYNTVCEVMTTTTPALVVPRVRRRREQLIRAEALARLGHVELLHPDRLTSEHVSAWWARAVGRSVMRSGVALDGLTDVGREAVRLLTATDEVEAARAI